MVWASILSPEAAATAQEKAGWKAVWEKTVEAAKKEGRVHIYFTVGSHLVTDEFEKLYPEIKVVRIIGRSSELVQRIWHERRAGKYIADVRVGGGGRDVTSLYEFSDPIKPILILPDVVDESKWWEGRHHYADPPMKYFFVFIGTAQTGSINYNTELVNPKEFVSFYDFLNAKWRGKIVARDPRVTGPGGGAMRFFYHNPALGPRFIRRLFSEMDITIGRDERQTTDWLGRGKFAICFFCRGIPIAKRQGLPVESFGLMKEGAGLASKGGIISLINRAPNPHAAKVFINWLLSREGQLAYQEVSAKSEGSADDSMRMDIPKDLVNPDERRREGVRYIDVDSPELRDMSPIFKILEEALAEAKKR
jgi:iron(III) transport system substrate-binding protein